MASTDPAALFSDPFIRLRLPGDETFVWCASNPTFHRTGDYGIVLTDAAVYTSSQLIWPFARWRRCDLDRIVEARFIDSRFLPCLRIVERHGSRTLRTPFDTKDEMDYDRRTLAEAAERINAARRR